MSRIVSLAIGFAALVAIAGGAVALQNESAAPVSTAAPAAPKATPTSASKRADQPPTAGKETPMAERTAVIGLLNKRNGISRDLTLKPGQAVRAGNVVVRLRACEATAPWETQKLTGAFVQVDRLGLENKWRRVFSGWLYKESPSLNVVEDPVYDVWPKSCTMTHPDIGPATTRASAGSPAGGKTPARRSSARKSAGDEAVPSAPEPAETAAPSNPT